MSRDHRSRDNWALLHAVHQARAKGVPVAVAFNLVESFLEARARHFGFMLRGLRVVERNLKAVDIPFFLFRVGPPLLFPAFGVCAWQLLSLPLQVKCLDQGETGRFKVSIHILYHEN